MKITNLNRTFTNPLTGKTIADPEVDVAGQPTMDATGKIVMIDITLRMALIAAALAPTQDEKPETAVKAFELAQVIAQDSEEIEIKSGQADTLQKSLAKIYRNAPVLAGQIIPILDGA